MNKKTKRQKIYKTNSKKNCKSKKHHKTIVKKVFTMKIEDIFIKIYKIKVQRSIIKQYKKTVRPYRKV